MRGVVLETGPGLAATHDARPRRPSGSSTTRRTSGTTGSANPPIRALARGAGTVGHHAEAPDLRADRRPGGRSHRRPAGTDRRGTQLGLPVHLGTRRFFSVHTLISDGLRRRGPRLRQLAPRPRHRAAGERHRPAEHHVPDRRQPRTPRGDPDRSGKATGLVPCADRKRSRRANSSWTSTAKRSTPCTPSTPAGVRIGQPGWLAICDLLDWLAETGTSRKKESGRPGADARTSRTGRLMCWVAFDRAIRLATAAWPAGALRGGSRERDAIYKQIMDKGWSTEREAFVQHYGDDRSRRLPVEDAARRLRGPRRPHVAVHPAAMDDELVSDSLVYRYDPSASPDGLRGSEGTFSLCTFLYVDALARAGRLDDARLTFEKMLTYANHVGLYSEEIAPTGEQIGNFPQAFTHLALIDAAITLNERLDDAADKPAASEAGGAGGLPLACVSDGRRSGRRPSCEGCSSPRPRPVHLQLRRLEHERDDQRHQRGPGHDRAGRPDRDHPLPAGHGGADDPGRQADRPLRPQALLHRRPRRLRHRRPAQRGRRRASASSSSATRSSRASARRC